MKKLNIIILQLIMLNTVTVRPGSSDEFEALLKMGRKQDVPGPINKENLARMRKELNELQVFAREYGFEPECKLTDDMDFISCAREMSKSITTTCKVVYDRAYKQVHAAGRVEGYEETFTQANKLLDLIFFVENYDLRIRYLDQFKRLILKVELDFLTSLGEEFDLNKSQKSEASEPVEEAETITATTVSPTSASSSMSGATASSVQPEQGPTFNLVPREVVQPASSLDQIRKIKAELRAIKKIISEEKSSSSADQSLTISRLIPILLQLNINIRDHKSPSDAIDEAFEVLRRLRSHGAFELAQDEFRKIIRDPVFMILDPYRETDLRSDPLGMSRTGFERGVSLPHGNSGLDLERQLSLFPERFKLQEERGRLAYEIEHQRRLQRSIQYLDQERFKFQEERRRLAYEIEHQRRLQQSIQYLDHEIYVTREQIYDIREGGKSENRPGGKEDSLGAKTRPQRSDSDSIGRNPHSIPGLSERDRFVLEQQRKQREHEQEVMRHERVKHSNAGRIFHGKREAEEMLKKQRAQSTGPGNRLGGGLGKAAGYSSREDRSEMIAKIAEERRARNNPELPRKS